MLVGYMRVSSGRSLTTDKCVLLRRRNRVYAGDAPQLGARVRRIRVNGRYVDRRPASDSRLWSGKTKSCAEPTRF